MSKLVWIHKVNANELGISQTENGTGRGSFLLVPTEAREIFFPDRDVHQHPEVNETITLNIINENRIVHVTYSRPPSKSEHRLSLSGLSEFIGYNKLLSPETIICVYRHESNINLSVVEKGSVYERLLLDFPSRGKSNNLVTNVIIDRKASHKSTNISIRLPKPFLILAGISGTGKTRFVTQQAEITGQNGDNYCLVPVRPDWHEPSDLLGYVSRLSGQDRYIVTPLLQFLIKAWKEIITVQPEFEQNRVKLHLSQIEQIRPFWLCLDEMNLAPVEQYFADYLSILETREWKQNNDHFYYQSKPIFSPQDFKKFEKNEDFLNELELTEDPVLVAYFSQYGIPLPFNLIVAGTVNMDETTHGFSRKVLDRALSFDFNEFYPNKFDQYFSPNTVNKALSYPIYSSAREYKLNDIYIEKSVQFLTKINQILINTPFELAYRALNELLLSVICFQPQNEAELQALWDDFLMMKVLPRIEGSIDKLYCEKQKRPKKIASQTPENIIDISQKNLFDDDETAQTNKSTETSSEEMQENSSDESIENSSSRGEKSNVLKELDSLLKEELKFILKNRIDLLRLTSEPIKCRSQKKLAYMLEKLDYFDFTSFWP
ncbi:McrB family protein [Lonepinella sp. BR2357]|uniref:McrB family protein n=1 Tax=Lonepinella sp. BR2357 TaxID=3434549 RepID=UPI003F6E4209